MFQKKYLNMKNLKIEKIHLYALIKPYDIIIALSFFPNETIGILQSFIEDTLRKLKSSSYKVGRVEKKLNDAILLPQYKISDFLKDNDEIIIYSIDYGLTKKQILGEKNLEDIDELFIRKKLKRKNSIDSTNINNDNEELKTISSKSSKSSNYNKKKENKVKKNNINKNINNENKESSDNKNINNNIKESDSESDSDSNKTNN